MKSVENFFDDEAEDYKARHNMMSEVHRASADTITKRTSGRTLCIGGMWPGASPVSAPAHLTIVDISQKMLALWADYEAELVAADARQLPFEDGSIDTIVYPMVLHHVCDGTAKGARQGVQDVFVEARRVLSPGGQVLILDFTIAKPVYAVELALAGLTRRLLAIKGIPLVIMHTAQFYTDMLTGAGFAEVENITAGYDKRPFELIQPVIGLPWLTVPRIVFPTRPLLLAAH